MDGAERGGAGGFTVLEAAIASMLLLSVMSSLSMLMTGSVYLSGTSRQAQAANYLANQIIEQVRALPYQTVANGLSSSDPTVSSDGNIHVNGSTYTYVPTGEVIPHGTLSYTQTPLTPHQTITTLDTTTYTVGVYPTQATGLSGVYRVTALVSWNDPLHGSMLRSVSAQTLVYSPSGSGSCLSTDTHPFAAPCSSSFYASVSTGAGSITVTPVSGSGNNAIAGINLTQAQLLLGQTYSTAQIEQTAEVIGSSTTSGGLLSVSGQPTLATGTVNAASDANDDPAITQSAPQSASVNQNATPISYSDGNTISITPTSADSASTTSVTSAGSGPACNDLNGNAQSNALPCGSGAVLQSSTATSLSAGIYAGSTSLGNLPIGSVGSPANPTAAFITRSTGAPSAYCSGATGSGCIHAGGKRNVGNVALAGIPTSLLASAPAGWAGSSCLSANALVQINGFSDSVTSESGSGSSSPAAGQSAGTLVYWNGSGCSSMSINWGSNPGTISVPTVTVSAPGIDDGVTVTISASLSLAGTTTSSYNPSGCTSPCTASATSASPLSGTVTYSVTDGSHVLANFQMQVSLGSLAASTSWQAA